MMKTTRLAAMASLVAVAMLMLSGGAGAEVTVDDTTLFKFATHGTYMDFDDNITADSITVNAGNATFTDIRMGTYTISSWVISSENADMTVNLLEEDNLEFDLDAGTGVESLMTTTVDAEPRRVKLNDVIITERASLGALHAAENGWYYSGGVAYVKTTHASVNTVLLGMANILPIVSPSITPTNPEVESTLTCTPNASDGDGDPVTVTHQWYRNGTLMSGRTDNTLIVPRLGKYKCGVTPFDGYEYGVKVYSGDATATLASTPIENMMPDLIGTVIDPFTDLIGDWFWAVILVVIIGGVYIKSETYGPPMAVMMVFSTLLTAVITSDVRYFFAIMSALSVAGMLYAAYTRRR